MIDGFVHFMSPKNNPHQPPSAPPRFAGDAALPANASFDVIYHDYRRQPRHARLSRIYDGFLPESRIALKYWFLLLYFALSAGRHYANIMVAGRLR